MTAAAAIAHLVLVALCLAAFLLQQGLHGSTLVVDDKMKATARRLVRATMLCMAVYASWCVWTGKQSIGFVPCLALGAIALSQIFYAWSKLERAWSLREKMQ